MSILQLAPRARVVLIGTAGVAILAIGWALAAADYASLTAPQWFGLVFLFGLYLLADAKLVPLTFASGAVSVNVSTAIDIALVLLFGPTIAVPFVFLALLVTEIHARRSMVKLLFNTANMVLSTGAAGLVVVAIGRVGESPLANGWQVAAWLLASVAHVGTNATLLALMISTASRTPFRPLWRELNGSAEMQQWTTPPMGALIAVLGLHSPWALVLTVLPLLAIYTSYRRYYELNRQTRVVVETLADTLDQRDPLTAQHSRRVTDYTRLIVEQLDALPISEAETIVAAARVHDLGKVAMSDACLHKAGPLDAREWAEMRRHPTIGATILEPLSMYQAGLTIVRHHHERWDGSGYPDGLAGERIPFGARVLAVADTFDAMTSDRPYRRALSTERALAEIEACRGTLFDPVVVDATLRAMRPNQSPVPVNYRVAGAE